MKNFVLIIIAGFIYGLIPQNTYAQGDGPRSYLFAPKGIVGINPKWLNLSQNIVPAGSIYLEDADLSIDVFPTTLFYNFGIGDRFAQVQFMFNPGNASGTIVTDQDQTFNALSSSGFSDGFAAFKIGLVGAPALSIQEFAKHTPALSIFGYLRVWYPGSYDSNKLLNLGTNRFTIELGTPMSIPLGKNPKRPIWIESYPYFQFYTKNTNPSPIVSGNEVTQKPLFGIENHISHNLTSKFWAGIDLHYKFGATAEVDGVNQDNKINVLGGGVSAGYQIFSFMSASTSYGTVIFGDNDIDSNMFRLSIVLIYANTKKQ